MSRTTRVLSGSTVHNGTTLEIITGEGESLRGLDLLFTTLGRNPLWGWGRTRFTKRPTLSVVGVSVGSDPPTEQQGWTGFSFFVSVSLFPPPEGVRGCDPSPPPPYGWVQGPEPSVPGRGGRGGSGGGRDTVVLFSHPHTHSSRSPINTPTPCPPINTPRQTTYSS